MFCFSVLTNNSRSWLLDFSHSRWSGQAMYESSVSLITYGHICSQHMDVLPICSIAIVGNVTEMLATFVVFAACYVKTYRLLFLSVTHVCWSDFQWNQVQQQISLREVVRSGLKFGTLVVWALLYNSAKIGELWPIGSPWVPKYWTV